MKRLSAAYWLVTVIMAAFVLMASVPDVLRVPEATTIFAHLGYPTYLLPFLGTAKILGVAAVVIPTYSDGWTADAIWSSRARRGPARSHPVQWRKPCHQQPSATAPQ